MTRRGLHDVKSHLKVLEILEYLSKTLVHVYCFDKRQTTEAL